MCSYLSWIYHKYTHVPPLPRLTSKTQPAKIMKCNALLSRGNHFLTLAPVSNLPSCLDGDGMIETPSGLPPE